MEIVVGDVEIPCWLLNVGEGRVRLGSTAHTKFIETILAPLLVGRHETLQAGDVPIPDSLGIDADVKWALMVEFLAE